MNRTKMLVVDVTNLSCLLDYWYDKIEDCYKNEVKASMKEFRKEQDLPEYVIRDYTNHN